MKQGPSGKQIVVGARSRKGKVKVQAIDSPSSENIHGFIETNVRRGSTIYTDSASAYRKLRSYRRKSVNHSISECVRGEIHTNGIKSFWALFKRGDVGSDHYRCWKHLCRYLNEF